MHLDPCVVQFSQIVNMQTPKAITSCQRVFTYSRGGSANECKSWSILTDFSVSNHSLVGSFLISEYIKTSLWGAEGPRQMASRNLQPIELLCPMELEWASSTVTPWYLMWCWLGRCPDIENSFLLYLQNNPLVIEIPICRFISIRLSHFIRIFPLRKR